MAMKREEPDNYADLLWAINGTRKLSIPKNNAENNILSFLDKKIKNLKDLGCVGFQEKFKAFDQLNAVTYLAELVAAEYFLKRGHEVILLGSECFGGSPSPDFLVKTQNGELFVEVTYMSSSDPASISIDEIQAITKKTPYIVNFLFNADVSIPHHDWKARDQQLGKLKRSVKQFASDLQDICVDKFPYRGKTDSFSYEIIEKKSNGKGYAAVLTSSGSTSFDFSFAYLTTRLQKKGKKRLTFPTNKQRIPYIVALICDEPGTNAEELCYLLYGSPKEEGDLVSVRPIPEAVKKEHKNKRWKEILTRLPSQDAWTEIQEAKKRGWEDILTMTYLLPHDYCYVEKPGLFFSDTLMHQVSGVLFCRCNGSCKLFPNLFSIDKMEYFPFWESF